MAEFLAQHSALIGLALITLVFIAFVIERYPPEVVACCGAIAFLLCGYLDTRQISDVFSNPAPITIAAMFVLSGTLIRTGVLDAAPAFC